MTSGVAPCESTDKKQTTDNKQRIILPDLPPNWFRRRVLLPLQQLLKQGLTPAQLALTVAVGVGAGTIPLLGGTTILSTVAALRLRLNVAAMLLISHLMTPVQLLALIPLLKWGARLLGTTNQAGLTLTNLRHLLTHDLLGAVRLLWRAELGALLLWLIGIVPLGIGLYFGLRPVFRRLLAKHAAQAAEVN